MSPNLFLLNKIKTFHLTRNQIVEVRSEYEKSVNSLIIKKQFLKALDKVLLSAWLLNWAYVQCPQTMAKS